MTHPTIEGFIQKVDDALAAYPTLCQYGTSAVTARHDRGPCAMRTLDSKLGACSMPSLGIFGAIIVGDHTVTYPLQRDIVHGYSCIIF